MVATDEPRNSPFDQYRNTPPLRLDVASAENVGMVKVMRSTDTEPLSGWVTNHRDEIDHGLLSAGAVLFRGFDVTDPAEFGEVASRLCDTVWPENGEHVPVTGSVQVPVHFPPDRRLLWHNENSFNRRWPARLMFCAAEPATTGGETLLVDGRTVLADLSPDITGEFLRRRVAYHRTYSQEMGLPWQKVFGTDDRREVERMCQSQGIHWRWLQHDRLHTVAVRPAVVDHPSSGDSAWFAQLQHWHLACLDRETRDSLLRMYPVEELPRDVRFGDGEPIPDDVMYTIMGAYEQNETRVALARGDVIVLDNVLTAHGRNPFTGRRRLYVALGDSGAFPTTDTEAAEVVQ